MGGLLISILLTMTWCDVVQIMLHCNGKIQMYFEKMLINQTFVVGLSNGIMPDVVEETPLTFIDESYKPQSRPSTMAVTMERQSVNTTGQSVNTIIARFSDEPDYQSTHQWQTQEAGVLTLEKLGHILEDTFILQQGISVNLVNALLSAGQIADDQLQMEAAKLLSKPDALDNGIMATLTNAAFDTSASEAHVLAAKLAFLEAAHDQERMTAATELVSLATFDDEDKAVAYRQLIASIAGVWRSPLGQLPVLYLPAPHRCGYCSRLCPGDSWRPGNCGWTKQHSSRKNHPATHANLQLCGNADNTGCGVGPRNERS